MRKVSNIKYTFVGDIGIGQLKDGTAFLFDKDKYFRIRDINFYRNKNDASAKNVYIVSCRGIAIHRFLFDYPKGYELDHINNDTFDNRECNLRICTHQQNQINQPLQSNNESGFAGVSFYKPRDKYRARIKLNQKDIHLGYYKTIEEAVQARNVAIDCLFGEYGKKNNCKETPSWIVEKVVLICSQFAAQSLNEEFREAFLKEAS